MTRLPRSLACCSVLAFAAVSCRAGDPPAPLPPAAPATQPAPQSAPQSTPQPAGIAPRYADADALLVAVERVSETLRDFRANVTLETTDDVTGDTERRLGRLVFVQDEGKPTTRRFAVVFDKFIDGSGRMDERAMRYVYADGWLSEADFTQRTLVRRQLARPGEQYDPLKPGEGPVPLPIGQRKADVLARFEATLAEAPQSALLLKSARPLVGVRLKPKAGAAERDLTEAFVWYDLQTLSPVGVEANRTNGRTVVSLRGAQLNAGLDDEQRALLSLASGTTDGWRVDERPLPAAASGGAAPAPGGAAP